MKKIKTTFGIVCAKKEKQGNAILGYQAQNMCSVQTLSYKMVNFTAVHVFTR